MNILDFLFEQIADEESRTQLQQIKLHPDLCAILNSYYKGRFNSQMQYFMPLN